MDPDQESHEYLQPANRIQEVYAGIFVLGAALLMGYFGVRGAIMHLCGSHEAPADPLASAIGIAVGFGGSYAGLRLLLGWRQDRALVPNLFLIIGGLGALAGALWFISIDRSLHGSVWDQVKYGYVFGGAGIASLILGWRRIRSRAS
jgi:hypothetical protein